MHVKEFSKNNQFSDSRKTLRWNYFCNTADGSLYALGMGMVPLNTVILFFISGFVGQKWLIGLISFLNVFLTYSPQILLSKKIEKLKLHKPFLIFVAFFIRLLWLILGLDVIFFAKSDPVLFVVLFYIIYSLIGLASAFSNIAWFNFIVKIIPAEVRGKFLGIRSSIAGIFESTGSLLLGLILKICPYPLNYGVLFIIVSAVTFLSLWVLSYSKETESPERPVDNLLQEGYVSRSKRILKEDINFTIYIITIILIMGFGKMAFAFQIIFAKEKLGITVEQLSYSTFILLASQTIGYLLWGILGDRNGFKITLEISTIIFIPSIIFTYLMSSVAVFYISMALFGLAQSARNFNESNLAINLCQKEENQPFYIGLRNLITGPFFALTPVIAGVIYDFLGYEVLFIVSAIFMVAGFYVMRVHVKEYR